MRNCFILPAFLAIISPANAQQNSYTQLSSTDFSSALDQEKITIIDVRTNGEFANGHIPNSGQLNYYALDFRQKLLLLPKDQPIYLYCNTGYRSERAARILAENGYDQVYNLEHGIMEWDLLELPVVAEPGARPDVIDKMEPDEYYALIQSNKPVFIDFYAPWCGPCRQMMPMIDSLKIAWKDNIKVVKINADASKKLVKELGIAGVPYFKMFRNGEEIFTHTGLLTESKVVGLFQTVL